MISIRVVTEPSIGWFQSGALSLSWLGQQVINLPGLAICRPSAFSETYYPDFLELGTFQQGSKAWGKLRDKDITHVQISGDLTWHQNSPLDSDQYGSYLTLVDGTIVRVCDKVTWGTEWTRTDYVDATEFLYQGDLITREHPYEVTRWLQWDGGDILIVWVKYHSGAGYKNGNYLVGPTTKWTAYGFRLIGGVLKSYTPQTFLTIEPTSSQVGAYISLMRSTAGTLVTTNWQLRTASVGFSEAVSTLLGRDIQERTSLASLGLADDYVDFGELALECAQSLKYVDSNLMLVILDLAEWRDFKKMFKNLVNFDGWKRLVRMHKRASRRGETLSLKDYFDPASSQFLFTNYGVLPTSSDVRRLDTGLKLWYEATGKDPVQRLHSRRVTSLPPTPECTYREHTATFTVEVASYPDGIWGQIMEFISKCKKWGMWPELTNLWDLVPYSFVLDWFIQFGDFFEGAQAYLDMENYFPIKYCIATDKWTAGVDSTRILPEYPLTGILELSFYDRRIRKECPLPPVNLSADITAINHIVESSALIMQRLR